MEGVSNQRALGRSAVLAAALALLNAALTFGSLWPTPMIRVTGSLSAELAAFVLLLVALNWWGWRPGRRALAAAAVLWVGLSVGRYADVTVQSLFGREINLYWDSRHFKAVGEMLTTVASAGLVVALAAACVVIPALLYLLLRWAVGRVASAVLEPDTRRALVALSAVTLILAVIQLPRGEAPFSELPKFATLVTPTYARQARALARELSGADRKEIAPPPPLHSDFSRVRGADVFLVFLESYGAVSWEHPRYVKDLEIPMARFANAVRMSGREVVSAYAESPTFGGSSWLAHVSLLTGVEVRDGDTNMRLMAQEGRGTLLTPFDRHGYRTVALMPGLRTVWPEGRFYGFDRMYGWHDLEYRGPTFGWWDMTDQYVLAKVDDLEVGRQPRQPLFVFFPTVSTHAPFLPAPPYQPDWNRMLDPQPYPQDVLMEAWWQTPDWLDLGPGYVKSLTYSFDVMGGYLLQRADRDFVFIVVGDHQPPSIVTGDGASWDVPVHVIASRRALLDRLVSRHKFSRGLRPEGASIAAINGLFPVLLDAFGNTDAE